MNLKVRLALMNFLQFAVWGAYLTCMGIYLGNIGLASHIGPFFAMQGIVSIFMPALMGIVADRWVPAQRLLGLCHLLAGLFMFATAWYGHSTGTQAQFGILFTFYSLSVAFYMPTLALSNSVAYTALTNANMDTVKDFPAHPCVWHHRFYLLHVVCRYHGLQVNRVAVCGEWCVEHRALPVYIHASTVSGICQ